MTTAVPSTVIWGVQWEVFVMPASFEGERPKPPDMLGEDPTEAEVDAYNEASAAFVTANAAFEAEMVTVAQDEANWFHTVSTMDDEQSARETLTVLRDANEGNPFNRAFELVKANRPRWVVVPVDAE
jgi:hypothetical protein